MTTSYLSPTGNDTTGDGSQANPYATIAKALSLIPSYVGEDEYVFSLADGTYVEPVIATRFVMAGVGVLRLVATSGIPGNVQVTGTTTAVVRGVSRQAVCLLRGPVRVELGVRLGGTSTYGALAADGATLSLLSGASVNGTYTAGVAVWDRSVFEYVGSVTIAGWSGKGIQAAYGSQIRPGGASALTLTGPGGAGAWGIHLLSHSGFLIFVPDCTVTITGVQYGFAFGFGCAFSHQGANGSTTLTNPSTPGESALALCTDLSSWSSTRPITCTNLTRLFDLNSISYAEAVSTRTLTNVGASRAVQNSIVYLP